MPARRFLVLAIALSWLAWLPAALIDGGATATPGGVLHSAGGTGPLLALIVALARSGSERALFRARLRVAPLASRYGPAALLLPIAFAAAAWAVQTALTGRPPAWPAPSEVAALALPLLLSAPLLQEPAWRGYALPQLLGSHTPLAAGLTIGAASAVWHLPLFFIEGTQHAALGIASADGAHFFVALLVDAVVLTWLVVRTGSLWGAVAYRWTTELAGAALDLPLEAAFVRTALTLLFVAVLVARGALRPHS
ncbi:MAG: CPBP family glutamic-type intramembrane protease [Pseudomonadota bacterium]